MKKIVLIGAAPVDGKMRYPSEGVLEVPADQAEALIGVGLAKLDDLATQKVEQVRAIAKDEGVAIGPAALKGDIVDAIRDRRENKA